MNTATSCQLRVRACMRARMCVRTCDSADSVSVQDLLASPQSDGLVLSDHRGLDGLQDGHLLPGDVGSCHTVHTVLDQTSAAATEPSYGARFSLAQSEDVPGPSKSHSSPATLLSPPSSTKSSSACRRSAVSGYTICSGLTS